MKFGGNQANHHKDFHVSLPCREVESANHLIAQASISLVFHRTHAMLFLFAHLSNYRFVFLVQYPLDEDRYPAFLSLFVLGLNTDV